MLKLHSYLKVVTEKSSFETQVDITYTIKNDMSHVALLTYIVYGVIKLLLFFLRIF